MDWYPFYPELFAADTMHLDPYQDGCYRRLIDHYMRSRSPLPDNDAALARIVGDSLANWLAMASAIVRPFFEAKNGFLHLKRCDEILDDQDARTKKLSEHGKKGAEKRWKDKNNGHPIATPLGSAMAQDSNKTRQDKDTVVVNANPREYVNVGKEVARRAGLDGNPNWFGDYSRVEAWLQQGFDPELDIYPTVERLSKRLKKAPNNLKYFEQAIADANASRLEPVKKGNPNENFSRKPSQYERKESALDRALAEIQSGFEPESLALAALDKPII